MTDTVWTAIVTFMGTGLLGLLGMIGGGKLIPVSKLTEIKVERDKYRVAGEVSEKARAQLAAVVDRQQLTVEITEKVLEAVRSHAAGGETTDGTQISLHTIN